jgi:pimeloyl-ACP methyl ester carboxylesterase
MPFVTSGQHRLYYEVIDIAAPWHARPQTILFHHGIGADCNIWMDWICALADRYRLVRFDMRGFGRSDVPDANAAWSMDQLSRDLLAVADATETSRCHVVGESIGGTIALKCALDHPERFASVILSNAAHVGGSIQKVEAWRRTIDEVGMTGWSDQFMIDRFHPGALPDERFAWFARQQAAGNRASVLNALSVLVGVDLRSAVGALHPPALLLHPDASPFIPLPIVADLYARLPDAELQVFAHARHGLPFSHGRDCGAALRHFLKRRFGPAGGPHG